MDKLLIEYHESVALEALVPQPPSQVRTLPLGKFLRHAFTAEG